MEALKSKLKSLKEWRKNEDAAQPEASTKRRESNATFGSAFGIIVSCLGSCVGTEGSLVFLVVWITFLVIWSSPIVVVEYTLGRYSKCGPIMAISKFLGRKSIWLGGWVVAVTLLVAAYYSVIVGWCMFYFVKMCALTELPGDESSSQEIFDQFTQETYWPLLGHLISMFLASLFLFGGLKWIEKANMVLVPLLLLIIVFTFLWSLSRTYADVGIKFLFTPAWGSFGNPNLWISAATQNAFDTGAGLGIFCAYAAYFTRTDGAVRFGQMIPIGNNFVSLICGITIFGTVFATLAEMDPLATQSSILDIMKTSGPAGTGLTFAWIPVLMSRVGGFGRVLCSLFFLCLSFAGLTTMISSVQLGAVTLRDLGFSQKIATAICLVAVGLVGVPSSLSILFLSNQDNAWAYALILSGGIFSAVVIYYGPFRYVKRIVNDFGIGDWKLRRTWIPIIAVLVPIEAVGLIIWWIYDSISSDSTWYVPSVVSLSTVLLEWLSLAVILILLNLYAIKFRPSVFEKSQNVGYDPYGEEQLPPASAFIYDHEIELQDIKVESSKTIL